MVSLLIYIWDLDEAVNIIEKALLISIPGVFVFYWSGVASLLISNTWRTGTTPAVYSLFIYIVLRKIKQKTGDPPLALFMAVNSVILVGYLHELPRYVALGSHLIRYNRFSVLIVDPSLVSIFILSELYIIKRIRVKWIHLATLFFYVFYFEVYLSSLEVLIQVSRLIEPLPPILVFRAPIMLFLIGLTYGLKTP